MAIIAGIDEAGIGPVLGPLVVSATVFEVPDERAEESFWKLLAGTVGRKPSKRRPVIAIDDSKKIYNRRKRDSFCHLERGVLSAARVLHGECATLRSLLERLAPRSLTQLDGYPWYDGQDPPVPGMLQATDVALSANSLGVALQRRKMRLLDIRSEPVFVSEFNRLIRMTDNKSTTTFDITCRLIMYLWECLGPGRRMLLTVDRQGGRMRYLPNLQRMFPGCRFSILQESTSLSAYSISGADRQMDISFAVQAERRQLPVALASMTSKYLREQFMDMFCRFWASHVDGIQPTAGYHTDGNRFYSEIQPWVAKLGFDDDLVVRIR